MSQPVYIQATEEVSKEGLDAVERAFDLVDQKFDNSDLDYRIMNNSYPFPERDDPKSKLNSGKSSLKWYENESTMVNPIHGEEQVNADRLSWLLSNEQWKDSYEGHVDLFITAKDLTARGSNGEFLEYILGKSSAEESRASIILSTYRLENGSKTFPEELMHTLTLNQIGHFLGAPSETRETDSGYRIQQSRCANEDIMQPIPDVETLEELNSDIQSENRQIYCGECKENISQTLEDL